MILKLTPAIEDHPANDGHAHLTYFDWDLQASLVYDGRTAALCFGGYGEPVVYTVKPSLTGFRGYPIDPQGGLSSRITIAQFQSFAAAVMAWVSSNAESLCVQLDTALSEWDQHEDYRHERYAIGEALNCLRRYLKDS